MRWLDVHTISPTDSEEEPKILLYVCFFSERITMTLLKAILYVFLFIPREDSSDVIQLISINSSLITEAARFYRIKPRILGFIIYTERRLNYTQQDELLDMPLAYRGFNRSIGLCQIRLNTAFWIEENLNNVASLYNLGENIAKYFPPSQNRRDLIVKLKDLRTNIHYAAVYLAMLQKRWREAGFDISDNPEILATLYSAGPYKPDGSERVPNPTPRANQFGELVKRFYESSMLTESFPKE